MAVNPLAARSSDQNTLSMSDIMRIPVGSRVSAAQSSSTFVNMLLNALTPIQIAQAFPDYYRDAIPDVSNFITKNIDAKLAAAGRGYDQVRGGDTGTARPEYTGESKTGRKGGKSDTGGTPQPEIPVSETKKTAVDRILEKAGISVKGAGVTSAKTSEEKINVGKGKKISKVVSTASTNLTPGERAILDTIAVGNVNDQHYWESPGYNVIVGGGGTFDSYENHPDVVGHISSKGKSDAAGRYQFLKSTWDETVRDYNKANPNSPITDFSPENQDRAALFLARKVYKINTGRNLDDDLANPPENFGELIKRGLGDGGPGKRMTWEAFTRKTSGEIGEAFSVNLEKNLEYAKEEVEAVAAEEGLDAIVVSPELQTELDKNPEAKKYFEEHPQVAKKLQKRIDEGGITIDDLSGIVEEPTKTNKIIDESSAIPSGTENREAIGGKRRIPLTEHETGIKILNRMDWVSEQSSKDTGETITYEIFSALQPPGRNDAERGGEGTGGYRHGTNVGAADVRIVATDANGKKRYITANSTGKDKEILEKVLVNMVKAGFTGIGIGKTYQGGHPHVGFGADHLWNSGAKGDVMKSEFSDPIKRGRKLAKEEGFDFDEYYEQRRLAALKKAEEQTAASEETASSLETDSSASLSETDYEKLNSIDFKGMSDDELQAVLEENKEKVKGKKPGELTSEDYLPLNIATSAELEMRDRQDLKEQRAKTTFVGDSIALGLGMEVARSDPENFSSHAQQNLSPKQIFQMIKDRLKPEDLKGQNIVLSSGISNDPSQLETVDEMVAYLKEKGANVFLAGTGTREDLQPLNENLNELSRKHKIRFLGGFEAADKVHPNYEEYMKSVNEGLVGEARLKRFRESQQQAESAITEKPVVDRREELGIGPDVTGEGLVLSGQDPEKYSDSIEKDKRKIEELSAAEPAPVPEEEPQKMAQGGFINEKDNLSVVNEEGKTLAKINEGEMIGGMLTEGTGMRVVSNNTRLADDIVERNDTGSPSQQAAIQQPDATPQKSPVMSKNQLMKEDQSWREMAANDSHQRGTQIRAFRRSKFMPEGYHFNRASPGSIA